MWHVQTMVYALMACAEFCAHSYTSCIEQDILNAKSIGLLKVNACRVVCISGLHMTASEHTSNDEHHSSCSQGQTVWDRQFRDSSSRLSFQMKSNCGGLKLEAEDLRVKKLLNSFIARHLLTEKKVPTFLPLWKYMSKESIWEEWFSANGGMERVKQPLPCPSSTSSSNFLQMLVFKTSKYLEDLRTVHYMDPH